MRVCVHAVLNASTNAHKKFKQITKESNMERRTLMKLDFVEERRIIGFRDGTRLTLTNVTHIFHSDSSMYFKHNGGKYVIVSKSDVIFYDIRVEKLTTHGEED